MSDYASEIFTPQQAKAKASSSNYSDMLFAGQETKPSPLAVQPTTPEQATPPTLQQRAKDVYGFKDYAKLGTIVPLGETAEGKTEFAMPQIGRDLLTSFLAPGHVAQSGTVTPADATNFAMNFAAPATASRGVGAGSRLKIAPPKEKPPTVDVLKEASGAAYQTAEDAGVAITQQSFSQAVDEIAAAAKKAGIDKTIHPNATAALARLQEAKGTDLTLQDAEILRRVLKSAEKSRVPDEQRIAGTMIDKLDTYIDRLSSVDIVAGDAPAATKALVEARGLWSRARKGEDIQDLIDRAEIRSSQFSGSGYENALRTEFRSLALNKNKMRMFTEEEQDAIKKVAMGGSVENILRFFGKLAPTGVVSMGMGSGAGAAIGSLIAGPAGAAVGGIGVPAVGFAARQGATALTSRNARLASELVRAAPQEAGAGTITPTRLTLERLGLLGDFQGLGLLNDPRLMSPASRKYY